MRNGIARYMRRKCAQEDGARQRRGHGGWAKRSLPLALVFLSTVFSYSSADSLSLSGSDAMANSPWESDEQPWKEEPWQAGSLATASRTGSGTAKHGLEDRPWDSAAWKSPEWKSPDVYKSGPWDESSEDRNALRESIERPQAPVPPALAKEPEPVKDRTEGRWEKGLDTIARTEGRRTRSEGLWDKSLTLPGRAELRWTRPETEDRTEVRWSRTTEQTAREDRTEGRWDAERESAADVAKAEAEEERGLEKTEEIRQRVGGRWLEQERIGERTERLTAEIGERWDDAQQRWRQLASAESEGVVENQEESGENEETAGEKQEEAGENQGDSGENVGKSSGEEGDKTESSEGKGSEKTEKETGSDVADAEGEKQGEEEEATSLKRDMAAIKARLDRQLEAYRKQRAARRAEADQRAFIGKDGVPMLTNRPEKYRRQSSLYKEIAIKYEPIVVEGRYRTPKAYNYKLSDLHEIVSRNAQKYGVSESLIYAMIQVESGFNPYAVSPAGARGLMQLMPGTAAEMGVTDIFDVAQNIAGGTQYVARMLEIFDNDVKLALAAYNAGPETVKKYGAIPPYKETQGYVRQVLVYYRGFGQAGAPRVSLAKHETPKADYVPKAADNKDKYTIVFHSGLTQVADKIVDNGLYYYVQYDGRVSRVRKEFVKEIVEPA